MRASRRKPALALDPEVVQGTPEDVVKAKRSYTGAFLAPVLARKVARRKKRVEAAE